MSEWEVITGAKGVIVRNTVRLLVVLWGCCVVGAAEKTAKNPNPQPDAIGKWIEKLKSDNPGDRAAAAKQLREYLRGPETVEAGFSDLPRADNDPEPPEVGAARLAPLANALRLAIDDK